MMRRPTPSAALYAWHRAVLADPDLPRHADLAECGWYRIKLVRGGPWVAVEIQIVRDIDPATGELTGPERAVAICEGRPRDPERMWTYLQPISRADHAALLARSQSIPAMAATMAKLDLSKEAMRP